MWTRGYEPLLLLLVQLYGKLLKIMKDIMAIRDKRGTDPANRGVQWLACSVSGK
jgi:hypothetical protein